MKMVPLPIVLALCVFVGSAAAQGYRPEGGRRERPEPAPAPQVTVRPPAPVHRATPLPPPRHHWGHVRDHGNSRSYSHYPVYGSGRGDRHPAPTVVYRPRVVYSTPVVYSAPVVYAEPVVYSTPVVYSEPVVFSAPVVAPAGPAANGFWLGALVGGILGHNSGDLGHSAWRGAALGAGVGLLAGSVIEAGRREPASYREIPPPAPPVVVRVVAPPAVPVRVVTPVYHRPYHAEATVLFGR